MTMADVQKKVKLTFETCRDSPCEMMVRGAAVAHGSVGYFSSKYSHDVFAYDSEKDDWSKLPECPQTDFGLAVINNLLTAVGGEPSGLFSGDYTKRLVSFNGSKWVTIFPPMPTKRYSSAVISAKNYLIAAGGWGMRLLSTVEVMYITTREWYTAASLPKHVCDMSATFCGGRLYLLGGKANYGYSTHAVFTCTMDSLLQSCHPPSQTLASSPGSFRLSTRREPGYEATQTAPHTNEAGVWQHIADVPVLDSTCTALNGRVLAVGGTNHGEFTADVYMYNADSSDSWPLVGCMSTPRSECLVMGLRDCIIAVGGCISTDTVEVGYLQLSGGFMVIILVSQFTPNQPTNLCVCV